MAGLPVRRMSGRRQGRADRLPRIPRADKGVALIVLLLIYPLCVALAAGLYAFPETAQGMGLDPAFMLASALFASILAGLAFALIAFRRYGAWLVLRDEQRSFRELYDNISEGVFRSTLDGRMISANPSLVRLNGYATEEELIRNCNDIATEWYVDPNRRAEIHEMLLANGKVTGLVSEVYRHKTRERIWIEENVRLVRDRTTGEPLYYDGTLREVTETMRRLELQDRYDKIASMVSSCLYQHRMTPDGVASMPYASIGLYHIFGVAPEAVAANATILAERIHPDDLDRIIASLKHSSETLAIWQCEYRVVLPDGTLKWVFAHSVPEREPDGSTLWHGSITDITEQKSSEEKIYELAYFDPLTRLPNRTMLREALRKAIAEALQHNRQGALLFIDLDHFKMLNDTKGHHVGDLLLCETAQRIRSCVRDGDLVARLGGDEFVVLLDALSGEPEEVVSCVERIGEAILAAIDKPFQLEDHHFQTTASIGIAIFEGDGLDVDDVLKRADLAMYEAKAAGRSTLRFFQNSMQVAVDDRVALTSDLRQANQDEKLKLYYQPQVDRAERWIGAEALLRWDHPTRGPISPAEFIPLAERNGFMSTIDEFVLTTACRTLKSWEGDPATCDLRLAVNISAPQLTRPDFVASVEEALRSAGANPERLKLELTEHVMLDDIEDVSRVMLQLKSIGVTFAIDDFGTGYSSLSYLKRLPLETLKIDRSFVRDLETDPSDREIVQTILNIARSLRVSVVAEGVETEMQALLLRQMGCQVFQGFLFAKPMPLDAFNSTLRLQRATATATARRTQRQAS